MAISLTGKHEQLPILLSTLVCDGQEAVLPSGASTSPMALQLTSTSATGTPVAATVTGAHVPSPAQGEQQQRAMALPKGFSIAPLDAQICLQASSSNCFQVCLGDKLEQEHGAFAGPCFCLSAHISPAESKKQGKQQQAETLSTRPQRQLCICMLNASREQKTPFS